MLLRISKDDETICDISCLGFHVWTGDLRKAPNWIVDNIIPHGEPILEEGAMMVAAQKALLIKHNGWPRADVGDLVIKRRTGFDIIRKVST